MCNVKTFCEGIHNVRSCKGMCFRENLLLLTLEALTSILCPEVFDQIFIFLNNSWWSNALGSSVKFLFSVFVTRSHIFHRHKVYFCCVPSNILFPFVEFLEKERHVCISWGNCVFVSLFWHINSHCQLFIPRFCQDIRTTVTHLSSLFHVATRLSWPLLIFLTPFSLHLLPLTSISLLQPVDLVLNLLAGKRSTLKWYHWSNTKHGNIFPVSRAEDLWETLECSL